MEKSRATLVRRLRLTETSLIVHWCTDSSGIVKTVAKGALRPKSPFAGKLDLFFEADIAFTRSRTSDLHTLRETEVRDPRARIRTRYPRLLAGTYFITLLETNAERETPIPELHDLLTRALDFLDREDPTRRAVLHYETQLARLLGLHMGGKPSENAIHAIHDLHPKIPRQRAELMDTLS